MKNETPRLIDESQAHSSVPMEEFKNALAALHLALSPKRILENDLETLLDLHEALKVKAKTFEAALNSYAEQLSEWEEFGDAYFARLTTSPEPCPILVPPYLRAPMTESREQVVFLAPFTVPEGAMRAN